MRRRLIISIAACLIITIIGAIIYSNTLSNPFLFDSEIRILNNPHIRVSDLTVENLKTAILKKPGCYSVPVANLTFVFNYFFHQYNPEGWHVVNILVHILVGFALFLFIKATLQLSELRLSYYDSIAIAFFTVLIWFTNPLHTQSVSYIVQRTNCMAALFYLFSFYLYICGRQSNTSKFKTWVYYAAAILTWIISLGCKQNTVVLPFFILLYEWFFFQNLSKTWIRKQILVISVIVIVVILVSLFLLGSEPLSTIKSLQAFSKNQFTYYQRVLTQPRVIIYYLSLFFFPDPARLNLDYDYPLSISMLTPITTILSIIFIIAILGLSIRYTKKYRIFTFTILWYFGNLFIESSFIPLDIIFEHRTYLPTMLIPLGPVFCIYRYVRRKPIAIGLLLLPTIGFSFWTYERNKVWQDKIVFWQDCVSKSPNKARPHFSLGAAYAQANDNENAMRHYKRALDIVPNYAEVHNNIGSLYAREDLLEQAKSEFALAIQNLPGFPMAINNMATVLLKEKKYMEAKSYIEKLLKAYPEDFSAYKNLGRIYEEQASTQQALQYYYKSLSLSPYSPGVQSLIGMLYAENGNFSDAESAFKEAIRLSPKDPDAFVNIGKLYQDLNKLQQAQIFYQKAIEVDNENAGAHYNLANLYMAEGSMQDAENHYREALVLNVEMAEAHFNLGFLLEEKGDTDKALDHYRKAVELKPDYASPYNNIGNFFSKKNDFDSAIPYYRDAIRLEPSFDDAHANLGIALMQTGDIDGARRHFQTAVQTNPSNQSAQKGLEIIQSAAGTPPPLASLETLHKEALEHAARGEYALAVKLFKKILDLVPSEPGTCYNIACMYAKMGRIPESIEWLTQAIQNGYDNWDAIKHDPDLENIREADAFKALIKDH